MVQWQWFNSWQLQLKQIVLLLVKSSGRWQEYFLYSCSPPQDMINHRAINLILSHYSHYIFWQGAIYVFEGKYKIIFKEIFEFFWGNKSFKMALVLTSTLTSTFTNSFIVEECCEDMINDIVEEYLRIWSMILLRNILRIWSMIEL